MSSWNRGNCFLKKHPNSFSTDDLKISYVISMLHGPPKKWGLSLKADGTLNSFKL